MQSRAGVTVETLVSLKEALKLIVNENMNIDLSSTDPVRSAEFPYFVAGQSGCWAPYCVYPLTAVGGFVILHGHAFTARQPGTVCNGRFLPKTMRIVKLKPRHRAAPLSTRDASCAAAKAPAAGPTWSFSRHQGHPYAHPPFFPFGRMRTWAPAGVEGGTSLAVGRYT